MNILINLLELDIYAFLLKYLMVTVIIGRPLRHYDGNAYLHMEHYFFFTLSGKEFK